jgi:hypothetical protein
MSDEEPAAAAAHVVFQVAVRLVWIVRGRADVWQGVVMRYQPDREAHDRRLGAGLVGLIKNSRFNLRQIAGLALGDRRREIESPLSRVDPVLPRARPAG